MPLPIILGIAAGIAGAAGIGSGIRGGLKMKEANDTMKAAASRHKKNIDRFEIQNKQTTSDMDDLGRNELEITKSFEVFQNLLEKIHNRPEFKSYSKDGVTIPDYDAEELRKVSVGAGVLLGGLGGAALGTAGGFAAAGVTTSAVMALGTASTGTAIASLSGVAATNATLAALGGGAIAAGGGGMALGSAILGGATLGVGLLVGGIIFNITGSSLSSKADEAWFQMKKAEGEINKICEYLIDLSNIANKYNDALTRVNKIYIAHIEMLSEILKRHQGFFWKLFNKNKINPKFKPVLWQQFSDEEKLVTENTATLVGLLYNMCKVQIVLKSSSDDEMNEINRSAIEEEINNANIVLQNLAA